MISQKASNIIRIASVPHDQVYIRHLEPLEGQEYDIARLPDPRPVDGGQSIQSAWWPPAMLNSQWIVENQRQFDLMHIHFGFDALDPNGMEETIGALKETGKPLVYTVHDLVNPHQPDPRAHRALLDVLIPSADELITLTDGAAAQIAAEWKRTAHVLPHPHVIDFPTMGELRQRREKQPRQSGSRTRRVGVHLKEVRANISPAVLQPLARIVSDIPGTVLQVNIHQEVLDPQNREYQPALARQLIDGHARGDWELEAHSYFTEAQLFAYLGSLDVCVLPYRFGTHSGWLEAALDAGAAVVVPDCGHYLGQHPSVEPYRWNGEMIDESSLNRAVRHQLKLRQIPGLDVEARRSQRQALSEAHRRIYTGLLAN
ncbi:glycosyltransferase [Glutamicibacter sp. MCAF14]|uniref:glycosyltransferase n=1 Tax=Glutamicibacter sp. MCAF14 TaxID=3233043 RepID=UPI003F93341C